MKKTNSIQGFLDNRRWVYRESRHTYDLGFACRGKTLDEVQISVNIKNQKDVSDIVKLLEEIKFCFTS